MTEVPAWLAVLFNIAIWCLGYLNGRSDGREAGYKQRVHEEMTEQTRGRRRKC